MKNYTLIQGDVTEPIGDGNKIIIHVTNNIFVMGAGVAIAIRKKWPIVYKEYKDWRYKNPSLGDVQFVKVAPDIAVGNMLGQEGIRHSNGAPPIRYEALDKALKKVSEIAKKYKASVHLPYLMGSGLAGGDWNKVEELIKINLCNQDVDVTIYQFVQNNTFSL